MPRDSSGNQTNASAPVVAGNDILASTYNTNQDDTNAEITDSLSRSGKGGMLAAFQGIDGTLAAPGLAFLNELGSGLHRAGPGDVRAQVLGQTALYLAANEAFGNVNGYRLGKVSIDGSLQALITSIGSAVTMLQLYPEAWPVPAGFTIPSNITLVAPRGVDIQVASGQTLTMPVPRAGYYKIFSGDGKVVFTGGTGEVVPPHWWGFDAAATAAANTAPFQKCINDLSYSGIYTIWIPSGHYQYEQVYLFYDPTLNPGFSQSTTPNRHGKFRLVGDGNLSIADLRTYAPNYGTVLEATGDGIVIARASLGHGTAPYPARHFKAQDITLVANKTGQYVVENASCPLIKFDKVSILQRHPGGHGVLCKSSWYTDFHDTLILNGNTSGVTGNGVVAGTAVSAGIYTFRNSLIDAFQDNFVWEEGQFVNVAMRDTALQGAGRYNIHVTGGSIQQLILDNPHFEPGPNGTVRTSDIKAVADGITLLLMQNPYHLLGEFDGTSKISGTVIDLADVEAVDITGVRAFRNAGQAYLNITAARNGASVGTVQESQFIHDNIAAVTGPIYLFAGVLPTLKQIAWTGMGTGVHDTTAVYQLYNQAIHTPFVYHDKQTESFLIRALSLGRPQVLTGVSTLVNLATYNSTVFDITNTVAVTVTLPMTATDVEGRTYIIKNNSASVGALNVRLPDLTLIAALAAGQSATFIYDEVNSTFIDFLGP